MRPFIPGLGPRDLRRAAPIDAAPWRAIGKLQANAYSLHQSCTGVLISADRVLSAAHCLYNRRTGRYFPPRAVHFLLGYELGHYAGHAVAQKIAIDPGYDPARPAAARGEDWVVITLDRPLGAAGRSLPLLAALPSLGAGVMLGGYSQDHPYILLADTLCRITGVVKDASGHALLRDDCTAPDGVSGAPLLRRDGGGWRIAGIAVAAELGTASGVAVPAAAILSALRRP